MGKKLDKKAKAAVAKAAKGVKAAKVDKAVKKFRKLEGKLWTREYLLKIAEFDGATIAPANGAAARADAMDFSDIYYFGGQSFVTVKDKADQFTDLASANKAEYSIGAQNGSIQYDLAVENTPDADIVSLTKVTDIIGDLLNDKLDGAFIETAVAENYAKNYPELVIVCDVPYDVAGSAIGVMKGNDSLMKGVNEAIAAALSDGSMDKFVAEANELSVGNVYEGLLDENGQVAEG